MPKYEVYPVGERKIIEAPDAKRAIWGYTDVDYNYDWQVYEVSDGEPDLVVGENGEIIPNDEGGCNHSGGYGQYTA